MRKNLVIIGSGGHGRAVLEAAILQNKYKVMGFVDDLAKESEKYGFKILGTTKDVLAGKVNADYFIIAIGNNKIRKNIFASLKQKLKPAIILHPSAVISPSSEIGNGTVVLANSVIGASVTIGENCIINSMCLIDHETNAGDHIHISQGTIIGSNVRIKNEFSSELGARIKSFSIIK
ncbi:MAG TPA: acetyltransferase [Bacteroidia bacterium]